MTRLRKLKCTFKRYALFSVFGFLENLEQLRITGYGIQLDSETWSSFPQNKNLRKLTLVEFRLPSWSAMSTIGKQFPNLEVFKLESLGCEGNSNWDLADGEFSNLKYLKLRDLYNLGEINVSTDCDNPFPCLEVLVVDHCPKLKEIPSSFGEISSLNTIKVSRCSREASKSANQILKQQRDLGSHSLQVFVTDILPDNYFALDEAFFWSSMAKLVPYDEAETTEEEEEFKGFGDLGTRKTTSIRGVDVQLK